MIEVLLTSTSFQDQKGPHLTRLMSDKRFKVISKRGPLKEAELKPLVSQFDAILCGDDEYTREILSLCKGRLKVLSKYGVGLDKIDLKAAKEFGIPVRSCAGVNSKSVAEHVFALLLFGAKNMEASVASVRKYDWTRPIGFDLVEKKLLIVGYGNIGKEVAKRALGFEMKVSVLDPMAKSTDSFHRFEDLKEAFQWADVVSLHCPMTEQTKGMINLSLLQNVQNLTLINTARGGLVVEKDIIEALSKGHLRNYLADVLQTEPIEPSSPFPKDPKAVVTPHIGSRTTDNIFKQGMMALENMYEELGLE
ncbi:MAG: NAD(P)-dependent oxidoreductase [Pseudobdellovibrionaceae bacterium]